MKRITVWIDSRDDDIENVREKVETFLKASGVKYTVLRVCDDLVSSEASK